MKEFLLTVISILMLIILSGLIEISKDVSEIKNAVNKTNVNSSDYKKSVRWHDLLLTVQDSIEVSYFYIKVDSTK